MSYAEFLARKAVVDVPSGIVDDVTLNPSLFPFQADIVRWALRRGRAAIFADCGMGKSIMELDWSRIVSERMDAPVLILAPLAVAKQTVREGEKFGIEVNYCRSQDAVRDGINITNYEMLHHFKPEVFCAVVPDESGILKSQDGATRTEIIESFRSTPYKLACTATPAPNDYMELGNHAEFLGVMTRVEMLSMFFTHDGGETQKWRIKRHAERDFWRWLASWSVMIRKPEDLGYENGDFILPPLNRHQVTVRASKTSEFLFAMPAQSLIERLGARRDTIDDRVSACAELVNASSESWVIWCNLNSESDALAKAIPGSVAVSGSDSLESKEIVAKWFSGHECPCGHPLFRAKLVSWKNVNRRIISASIIGKTGIEGSANRKSTAESTEKKSASTSLLTTGQIEKSTNAHQTNNGESTRAEGNCTLPIQGCGKSSNRTRRSGGQKTLTRDLTNECGDSEFPPPTITDYFPSNMDRAQSAEDQTLGIDVEDDFTSIIVTPQGKSGAFSVPTATWELESLETTQIGSKRRQCICGHMSGRRILISKCSILGHGMNWQHCHNVAFVGLSDSWEAYYQAVRRCYRFGQMSPVDVYVITADTEGAVVANIDRKEKDAEKMAANIVEHMKESMQANMHGVTRTVDSYAKDTKSGKDWTMHLGDCVEVLRGMPDNSLHYSVFSPPFASLYTYSASDRDLGNCKDHEEFFAHFKFVIAELCRVIMPGRLVSMHCMDLPTSKTRDGVIGLHDFRGDVIRAFEAEGFIYHSSVCIWKDPVTAMQRTKALGLLHKQIKKDSCMSRQGIPDYVVTMRKPGDNPERVTHTNESFPVDVWQRYASPIWMDINPSDTLQYRSAREAADERHICPLQLTVIRRCIELWTNPGDTVLSPFAGIGSEGFVALQLGRKFVGAELKQSYWKQACNNLATAKQQHGELFAGIGGSLNVEPAELEMF